MTTDLLATLLTTQFLLFSHPAPPDSCGLVSSTEIASALGNKPSPGRTVGPSVDEETGTKVSACSWKGMTCFSRSTWTNSLLLPRPRPH